MTRARASIIQSEEDVVVDALKTIPGDHVHQICVVVFDLKGVVAVELFTNPDARAIVTK